MGNAGLHSEEPVCCNCLVESGFPDESGCLEDSGFICRDTHHSGKQGMSIVSYRGAQHKEVVAAAACIQGRSTLFLSQCNW